VLPGDTPAWGGAGDPAARTDAKAPYRVSADIALALTFSLGPAAPHVIYVMKSMFL